MVLLQLHMKLTATGDQSSDNCFIRSFCVVAKPPLTRNSSRITHCELSESPERLGIAAGAGPPSTSKVVISGKCTSHAVLATTKERRSKFEGVISLQCHAFGFCTVFLFIIFFNQQFFPNAHKMRTKDANRQHIQLQSGHRCVLSNER